MSTWLEENLIIPLACCFAPAQIIYTKSAYKHSAYVWLKVHKRNKNKRRIGRGEKVECLSAYFMKHKYIQT